MQTPFNRISVKLKTLSTHKIRSVWGFSKSILDKCQTSRYFLVQQFKSLRLLLVTHLEQRLSKDIRLFSRRCKRDNTRESESYRYEWSESHESAVWRWLHIPLLGWCNGWVQATNPSIFEETEGVFAFGVDYLTWRWNVEKFAKSR